MSGVRGVGSASGLPPGVRAPAASGSGFSVPTGGTPVPAAGAAPVSAAALAGLLSLQEAGGAEVQDREARRRGHDLLDELAALQRDLLSGQPLQARVERLGTLLAGMPTAADPRLRDVMDQITLRVRIELVHYGAT